MHNFFLNRQLLILIASTSHFWRYCSS